MFVICGKLEITLFYQTIPFDTGLGSLRLRETPFLFIFLYKIKVMHLGGHTGVSCLGISNLGCYYFKRS